jgi:hypothetical protein
MSSVLIPKENLTAWQRWELGSFDQKASAGGAKGTGNLPPPTMSSASTTHTSRAGPAMGKARRARMEPWTAPGQHWTPHWQFDQQVAEELLGLSLEVARQVVRQTIAARPAVILDVVREALTQLPHQHAAIYLHPEDASLVRSYLGDQLTHLGHRIFEEASRARGGLRMEAGGSHLFGRNGVYRLYAWNRGRASPYANESDPTTENHSGWGLSVNQEVAGHVTVFGRYGHSI